MLKSCSNECTFRIFFEIVRGLFYGKSSWDSVSWMLYKRGLSCPIIVLPSLHMGLWHMKLSRYMHIYFIRHFKSCLSISITNWAIDEVSVQTTTTAKGNLISIFLNWLWSQELYTFVFACGNVSRKSDKLYQTNIEKCESMHKCIIDCIKIRASLLWLVGLRLLIGDSESTSEGSTLLIKETLHLRMTWTMCMYMKPCVGDSGSIYK